MEQLLTELLEISIRIIVGVIFSMIIVKLFPILFNFKLVDETRNRNQAASLVWLGIFVLVGLVVAFFRI